MRLATTLVLTAFLALAATGQNPGLSTEPFISGLSLPIDITHAGDGSGRLFVHEKGGTIIVFGADGTRLGTFLDISDKVTNVRERGLLGLAFAPDYATSGRFYLNYSNDESDNVIARYTTATPASNDASAATEEILLTVAQPFTNHNGGDLAFGPDGLLYVASGDGGAGNDPQAQGQDLSSLLGAILRLDVSGASGYVAAGGYAGAAPEVFAAGLRNPWRMSFDGDDLYIGDVGQSAREEIDRIDVTTATDPNFGWVCYEGSLLNDRAEGFAASDCQPYAAYVPPVYEYPHSGRKSVTGGLVYRGTRDPTLRGFYIFGDFESGDAYALRGEGASQEVYVVNDLLGSVAGFGTDEGGEMYAVSFDGTVSRVVSTAPTPVTVTAFSVAAREDCSVEVRWSVAGERDLSHYEVQLAGEDFAWAAFAKTSPAGGGEYVATVVPTAAARYVRLNAVDADGSSAQTDVRRLPEDCVSGLNVTPSATRAGTPVTVHFASTDAPIELVDAVGRVVYTVDTRGLGHATGSSVVMETAALPRGLYVVRQGRTSVRLAIVE